MCAVLVVEVRLKAIAIQASEPVIDALRCRDGRGRGGRRRGRRRDGCGRRRAAIGRRGRDRAGSRGGRRPVAGRGDRLGRCRPVARRSSWLGRRRPVAGRRGSAVSARRPGGRSARAGSPSASRRRPPEPGRRPCSSVDAVASAPASHPRPYPFPFGPPNRWLLVLNAPPPPQVGTAALSRVTASDTKRFPELLTWERAPSGSTRPPVGGRKPAERRNRPSPAPRIPRSRRCRITRRRGALNSRPDSRNECKRLPCNQNPRMVSRHQVR